MKRSVFVVLLFCTANLGIALIPPGTADATTAEGWKAMGFPVDDYVPWSLWIDAKEIVKHDGKYLVVEGYLVASQNSIILYVSEDASRLGRTDGALVLTNEDSPALRWLFAGGHAEGYFAIGGVYSQAMKGPILGHLTKVRFAMKKEPNQSTEPTL